MDLKPCAFFILLCLVAAQMAWAGPSVPSPELSPVRSPEPQRELLPEPKKELLPEPEAVPPPKPPTALPGSTEDYRVGAGDILSISVWQTPDLTLQLAVLPDGSINYPLVGEIMARDRTVLQLTAELKERLAPYVTDPELTLAVSQVNSMMVYVIGKVNKSGRFRFHNRIDVLQALALAGGTTTFAREKQIRIFRKQGRETRIFDFNYKAVSKGLNMEQNIRLCRGDVVVVP